MKNRTLYAIVDANGTLKARAGHVQVFRYLKIATNNAKRIGDSVVEVTVHLDKEPLFIRERVVRG